MAEVYIDGVLHTPGNASNIGIGITTHNRPEILAQALLQHHEHMPAGAKLVVVDDASTDVVEFADYRFEQNAGVARAKNKALELLAADPNIQHFFLWDEDAWPITNDWHLPYIESPSDHLMYQFKDLAKGPKLNDMDVVYEDDQHIAYTGARGVMLYVTRKVLDTVGGLDPEFGKCLYEHLSWSDRIHNAGLSLYRYADVKGSNNLIHSMDEYCEVTRSVSNAERQALLERNKELWLDNRDSSHYIEYRDLDDVILTCYFTGVTDSQRPGKAWKTDYNDLKVLLDSLKGRRVVIFHNQDNPPERAGVEWVHVPVSIDVYWQCWYAFHKWLSANPVRYVWCVDSTDVELLDNPFASVEPGRLYCGWEPNVVGCEWMTTKHTSHLLFGNFLWSNPDILLNSGVLGGDHTTVLEFCQKMVRFHGEHAWLNFQAPGKVGNIGPDMGGFNYVAYEQFRSRLVTGPAVTTVFKQFDSDNKTAIWRHK